ncbi:pyridoxal-phosphate dependent enzyme [Streptomyces erythrogriseus]
MIHPHIADALKVPDLVRLTDGLVLLRFESMKIYSALAAVRHLLERGTVRPGQTLIDSSSGIYAYALALACHRYGMRCHIVASTTVDATTLAQLEILGATVEQVRPSRDLKLDQELRVRRVREILAERPGHHWMRQYHDDIHYLGYQEVADRITAEFPHASLSVVGGVGSGASTGGIVERLRATDPPCAWSASSPSAASPSAARTTTTPRRSSPASARPSSSTTSATTSTTPCTGWTSPTPCPAPSPCSASTRSSPDCPPVPAT